MRPTPPQAPPRRRRRRAPSAPALAALALSALASFADAQACSRVGWYSTSNLIPANPCPSGYRYPTSGEYSAVTPCMLGTDTLSYYSNIVISVGGCGCKWNSAWVRQTCREE